MKKEFNYEGREMNGIERIAASNIKHCINWIVGGYYNAVQDECHLVLPHTMKELEDEIYKASITHWYGVGCEKAYKAPREMRFAGEKFIREYIRFKLEDDEDVIEILEYSNK